MNSFKQVVADDESTTCSVDSYYWKATTIVYETPAAGEDLAESTPANSELLSWAARQENQPPQEWFDNDDDPFE